MSLDPKDKMGTLSTIIVADKKDTNKVTCLNWVPGLEEDQNPYRSELAGINGALATISKK